MAMAATLQADPFDCQRLGSCVSLPRVKHQRVTSMARERKKVIRKRATSVTIGEERARRVEERGKSQGRPVHNRRRSHGEGMTTYLCMLSSDVHAPVQARTLALHVGWSVRLSSGVEESRLSEELRESRRHVLSPHQRGVRGITGAERGRAQARGERKESGGGCGSPEKTERRGECGAQRGWLLLPALAAGQAHSHVLRRGRLPLAAFLLSLRPTALGPRPPDPCHAARSPSSNMLPPPARPPLPLPLPPLAHTSQDDALASILHLSSPSRWSPHPISRPPLTHLRAATPCFRSQETSVQTAYT
ncbi:hypothetical protein BV20DRAFT_629090 [Pilatotrama ljubarskyi]|nr:hypothetical protein BV20DRAFT_629090 [Pilatotrama ljubarskyi]